MPGREPLRQPQLPRFRRGLLPAVLPAVLLAGLAGCGNGGPGAVAVPVPVSSEQVGVICDSMAQSLPKQVDGQKRRDTTPSSSRTAAWGDPPVVLRCGVARPKALKRTSQLNTVNGVDWFVQERGGGHVFTSVNRAVYVEISVPAGHDPQVGPLVDVAPAMQYVPVRPEFDQLELPAKKPKSSAKPKP